MDDLLRAIFTSRVYDVARETPLDVAEGLSVRTRNTVLLKREDLQPIFSFKLRGAYNRIAQLSDEERSRGVLCVSAGNHAQGVAFAAKRLGIPSTIVMPRTTPAIKVAAVRALGAEVVLEGDDYPAASAHCDAIAPAIGAVFVHPFDDPWVIAGQGTIGDEIVRQSHSRLYAVFVPVGGGGLIAGIAAYVKAVMPDVRVVGVEPFESDALYQSLEAGRRVTLDRVGIFVDGVAVRTVGERTFELARQYVDEVVRVSNDAVCAAIREVFEDTRSVMEPAGALAGLRAYAEREGIFDRRLVAVLSGANMNFDRLRFVAKRAELGEEAEAIFAVTIPERPRSFRAFCSEIGPRVITEFNYRLSSREVAHIFVGVSISSRQDAKELAAHLNRLGYETVDLSDDEVTKLHVRHMVGGRAEGVDSECACRFEFPERPGALLTFLDTLGGRWNISLFHYRNHGADFGRVLAAFEVPEQERSDFLTFLDRLGYRYTLLGDSRAFSLFLGGGATPSANA